MAWVFVTSFCVACRKQISFNPDRVPSLPIGGVRQPLCRSCFGQWNEIHRTRKGLEPVPLHPDAYEPQEVA